MLTGIDRALIDRAVRMSLVLVPLGFAVIAWTLGQDANWDLRNYHWYNPYAFLTGRLGTDLAVAHVATFYNPLLDLPVYLTGRSMPAQAVGALLGFIHGLNYTLLYGVAAQCIHASVPDWHQVWRRATAAILALVGVLGGGHLALVGTTFNDNIVSLAVLGSLLIIARRADAFFAVTHRLPDRRDVWPVMGAGAVVGLAVGLKLPTAIFAVGLCLAFLCVGGGFARRVMLAFVFGLGVTFAFVIADGPWMWSLWRDYANPLFPYFNTVFHSPMATSENFRDARFIPTSAFQVLAFPWVFSRDPHHVGEIAFSDYRILAAYAALIVAAAVGLAAYVRGRPRRTLPAVGGYIIAMAGVTYLAWMPLFAVYRYIVGLEMLAPLLMAIAVMQWPLARTVRFGIIAVALIALTLSSRRGDWTHVPWQPGPFVNVSVPPIAAPADTLALITGIDPVGWLLPYFPPQIPFIRLQGYLNNPEQPKNGLNDRARATIEGHAGDIFLLVPEKETDSAEIALRAYGLAADWKSCWPVVSNLSDYARWCRVYRGRDAAVPSTAPPTAE